MSIKFWKTFTVFWNYGFIWWKKVYRAIIKISTSDIFLASSGSLLVLLLTFRMDTLTFLIGFLALVIIWYKYFSIKESVKGVKSSSTFVP
jgi:membrane protein implicated in regulation of membrane protease activity